MRKASIVVFLTATFWWLAILLGSTHARAQTYFAQGALIEGTTTTVVSGVTVTLNKLSLTNQRFIGTGGEAARLPVSTSTYVGRSFNFLNDATGALTIELRDGSTLGTVRPGTHARAILTGVTSLNGTWTLDFTDYVNRTGDTMSGALYGPTLNVSGLTADRLVRSNPSKELVSVTAAVTDLELSYLSGLTANVQTQINNSMSGVTGNFLPLSGGSMTGSISAIPGSTASPSVNFTGDTDTGVYSPATGSVAIVTDGTQTLRVVAGGVRIGVSTATVASNSVNPSGVNPRSAITEVTEGGEAALALQVLEGTNNRRVKFYLNDTTGDYGFTNTKSTGTTTFSIWDSGRLGAADFMIGATGSVLLGVTTAGTGKLQVQGAIGIGGSSLGQTVIQSPATATGTYTLPAALPTAANQALRSTTAGVMSWSPSVLTGVTTANNVTMAGGVFTCSSSSSIVRQPGTFFTSIGNISSGNCTLNFDSNQCTQNPVCVPQIISGGSGIGKLAADTSSSQVSVRGESTSGAAATSYDFHMICTCLR